MKLHLPASLASSSDLASVEHEIHTYASWLNQAAIKARVTKQIASNKPALSPTADQIISSWCNKKEPTAVLLDTLLSEITSYKKTAPHVTITLAALPPNELKSKIVSWVRSELHDDMLVSFKMNKAILGGMVVVYGSRIFDWSFKRKLTTSTASFSEVLRRV